MIVIGCFYCRTVNKVAETSGTSGTFCYGIIRDTCASRRHSPRAHPLFRRGPGCAADVPQLDYSSLCFLRLHVHHVPGLTSVSVGSGGVSPGFHERPPNGEDFAPVLTRCTTGVPCVQPRQTKSTTVREEGHRPASISNK